MMKESLLSICVYFCLIKFERAKKRKAGEGTTIYNCYNVSAKLRGKSLFCGRSMTLYVTKKRFKVHVVL